MKTLVVKLTFLLAIGLCLAHQEKTRDQADSIATADNEQEKLTIGFPRRIEAPIPGSELQVIPNRERDADVILRIVETYPHGEWLRYNFEYICMEPGEHNLIDYLERVDGSSKDGLKPVMVSADAVLPPGQVEPSEAANLPSSFPSFYLVSLLLGGALWLAGLFAILFGFRGKVFRPTGKEKVPTVAERMKPLVDLAVEGKLDTQQQAELERVMVGFWRKKLKLGHLSAADLRVRLRENSESSQLLEQMDKWLHRPETAGHVNVTELLKPYQTMNYDEI